MCDSSDSVWEEADKLTNRKIVFTEELQFKAKIYSNETDIWLKKSSLYTNHTHKKKFVFMKPFCYFVLPNI